jgi:hypothetical protein
MRKAGIPMEETDEKVIQKPKVHQFLKGLEVHLNAKLPSPQEMRKEVREIVANARKNDNPKHLKSPEAVFTNDFLIPHIFDVVVERAGKDKAQQCILSEYREMRKAFCGTTSPQRQERHPFGKGIADKPETIMRRWRGNEKSQIIQSAPDLALREPFPFNIVFELKYFEKGGAKKATTELVTDLYQAFFYRALPYVPPKGHYPSWDYNFACLIACDSSEDGALHHSWNTLPQRVKDGFWDGANVYAMILRNDNG